MQVNPQVGAGSIVTTSTAVLDSKFGMGVRSEREAILAAFASYPWLTAIHFHTGSQVEKKKKKKKKEREREKGRV